MTGIRTPVVVLGAGPAGLGAAYRLARRGCFDVTVVERNPEAGGNAGSFDVAGLRVDYGSHRLHPSCAPGILTDIQSMLGDDLLDRPRHGRMRLRGRWVHFPLKPVDLARNLPLDFTAGTLRDVVLKPRQHGGEETFASILERGLGRTICRDFYFPYARKIWGVDPAELDAEQARRRVSAGSVLKLIRKVMNAVPGMKRKGAGRFYYPRNGFGAISEAYCGAAVRHGATVRFDTRIAGIEDAGGSLIVHIQTGSGFERLAAKQVLSTIPISALVRLVDPPAPESVQKAACELQFRSMILVYLVLETGCFTEFDAHYFPDPRIAITRLSEPKNYGLAALPGRTVLCAELPCSQQDPAWKASDQELEKLVIEDLAKAGIPVRVPVNSVSTRRLPQAYPIYNRNYRLNFERMDAWIGEIDGLVTFGRQGLFAHDNTHHALAMAYALDECLNDRGELDRSAWTAHRRRFEHHVVED